MRAFIPISLLCIALLPLPADGQSAQFTTGPVNWDVGKFRVHLDAPVAVSLAAADVKHWGHHQFVSISPYPGGRILLRHHSAEDSVAAYGTASPTYISADEGKTWAPFQEDNLPNNGMTYPILYGDFICLPMAKAFDVKTAGLTLPAPVAKLKSYQEWTGYLVSDCPAPIQDYVRNYQVARWSPGTSVWTPDVFTYEISGALAWLPGNPTSATLVSRTSFERPPLRVGEELLFADYRTNFVQPDRTIPNSWGVSCMVSQDNGKSWKRRSTIALDPAARDHLTEPMLAAATNGDIVCVIRRADHEQKSMCITYSSDKGNTWEPYRSLDELGNYGVFPALVKLDCGIMVFSYGRPGVQMAFSIDGNGRNWTEPYSVLPGDAKKPQAHTDAYTVLLPLSKNSLLLAYTDFKFPASDGTLQKAILVRRMTVEGIE